MDYKYIYVRRSILIFISVFVFMRIDRYSDMSLSKQNVQDIKSLKTQRAVFKRKITLALDSLTSKITEKIDDRYCAPHFDQIQENLSKIKTFDEKINEYFSQFDLDDSENTEFEDEIKGQSTYEIDMSDKISYLKCLAAENQTQDLNRKQSDLPNILSSLSIKMPSPPPLQCGIFKGNSDD